MEPIRNDDGQLHAERDRAGWTSRSCMGAAAWIVGGAFGGALLCAGLVAALYVAAQVAGKSFLLPCLLAIPFATVVGAGIIARRRYFWLWLGALFGGGVISAIVVYLWFWCLYHQNACV